MFTEKIGLLVNSIRKSCLFTSFILNHPFRTLVIKNVFKLSYQNVRQENQLKNGEPDRVLAGTVPPGVLEEQNVDRIFDKHKPSGACRFALVQRCLQNPRLTSRVRAVICSVQVERARRVFGVCDTRERERRRDRAEH